MSIDLTLAFDCDWNSRRVIAYSRLEVTQDYHLFALIRSLPQHQLPPKMEVLWYDDDGCRYRTDDAYGAPLRWVKAIDLAKAFFDFLSDSLKEEDSYTNATYHFLANLPPDTPVILFWH